MTPAIFALLGGIGLFLLGMSLLTEGLKAFAGDALRRALVRFTGTPFKAFGSGALATAMVQSSSATTVTVIGFVSAGLLTFPQAVGVVMGASLGTTATGWIVAGLGLKISMGFYALPIIGVGAFMHLLGRGRIKSLGLAFAGFGIIFTGIDTLQQAMGGLAGVFDLAALPATGWTGHLAAMLIGIVLTVLMQSSSAAVATTLTALHTGSVNFEQAASLVIGSAIGTTVTGALAAIGGSVPAKRTAVAHVSFNLATGLIAVAILPGLLWLVTWAQANFDLDPGASSLAAFHTLFIGVGVLVFLPWAAPFARLIERFVPEDRPALTRHLDDTLLHTPAVALEATRRVYRRTARHALRRLDATLGGLPLSAGEPSHAELRTALEHTRQFFTRIPTAPDDSPLSQDRVAQLHVLDHLTRLLEHGETPASVRTALADPRFAPAQAHLRRLLQEAAHGLTQKEAPPAWLDNVAAAAAALAAMRRDQRPAVLRETSAGSYDPATALDTLDAMRWLDRLGYHTWRCSHYLAAVDNPRGHRETPAT
jgi:phosphate:Na+ symporter